MLKLTLLTTSFVIVSLTLIAQNQNNGNGNATSLNPAYVPKTDYRPKQTKPSHLKTTVDLQREYYERVEAVAKQQRKAERLMKKPQYSDPSYFGHRRRPTKHARGKIRYCKECGIRH